MARDLARRRLSRLVQNERRKAQRRLKRIDQQLADARQSGKKMLTKELLRQQKLEQDLASMTTRGKTIEESQQMLNQARNRTTINEMTQVMAGKRNVSKQKGSTLHGMTKAELQAFYAVTSNYAIGASRGQKLDKIMEGINRDFGVNIETYEGLLAFVRQSGAFRDLMRNPLIEGELKYEEYRQIARDAPRYQINEDLGQYNVAQIPVPGLS